MDMETTTTTLRTLITQRIIDALLESPWYGEWLGDGERREMNHKGVVQSLHRINDVMLMKCYDQLYTFGNRFIPCHADMDGKFLNIWIKGYYGGMAEDGSMHT